jgi:FYVE, RhoGEF and PH domain containing 5/6
MQVLFLLTIAIRPFVDIILPITDSAEERDEWSSAIRDAKASLLLSLHVMNPNSTLTASTSTNHLRHALQALPYAPDEETSSPKRGRVEHFVPAVWIPDGKTESCMRCGRTFGWRRRRHHCRLCGRCICAQCSTKVRWNLHFYMATLNLFQTFFIIDSTQSKDSHKSARACDACYETVFPIIDRVSAPIATVETLSRLTLSGLRSMPSLLLDDQLHASPSFLMTVGFEQPERLHQSEAASIVPASQRIPSDDASSVNISPIRIKAPSRPRSYIHILEDFNDSEVPEQAAGSPSFSRLGDRVERASYVLDDLVESDEDASMTDAGPVSAPPHVDLTPIPPMPHREDTVRKRKRFSLPALAIHTAPVTTRPNAVGDGKSKRWSLVLGNWRSGATATAGSPESSKPSAVTSKLSELLKRHSQHIK